MIKILGARQDKESGRVFFGSGHQLGEDAEHGQDERGERQPYWLPLLVAVAAGGALVGVAIATAWRLV